MLSRARLSLKSRGTKPSMERGGEGAKHGIPCTHWAVLGILRRPGGFKSQLCQLAGSPRMRC